MSRGPDGPEGTGFASMYQFELRASDKGFIRPLHNTLPFITKSYKTTNSFFWRDSPDNPGRRKRVDMVDQGLRGSKGPPIKMTPLIWASLAVPCTWAP